MFKEKQIIHVLEGEASLNTPHMEEVWAWDLFQRLIVFELQKADETFLLNPNTQIYIIEE